jgi:hypothetical protein
MKHALKLTSSLFFMLLLSASCGSDKTTKHNQLNVGDCEAERCKGKTEEGKRCKNDTKNCNRYCHIHQDQR